MTEEKRKEAKKYKQKAIEIEQKLMERKKRNETLTYRISSAMSSFGEVTPRRQSTPARPATLNLLAKHYVAPPTSDFEPVKDSTARTKIPYDHQFISSQTSTKNFRSTLEQRLANEDVVFRNRKNKLKQSPILEEHYPVIMNEYGDSDDSKKDRKRWSPLKIDSLNSLRIELPNKDGEATVENLDASMDGSETVTPSPSLLRQNSYTLLTPSPALLNYLESQKNNENTQRSHSGRKTWDLTKAKKSWDPDTGKLSKSLDEGHTTDESERILIEKRNFGCGNLNSTPKASPRKLFVDDGSTSPSSCNSKINLKHKTRSKKLKPCKNVPSPQAAIDLVPLNSNGSESMQGALNVPSEIKRELADLSGLLLKLKLEHERQKKELEERQRVEIKQLESIFKKKETEILTIVSNQNCNKKYQKSIYSQYTAFPETEDFDARMTGDGSHIRSDPKMSRCFPDPRFDCRVRPHSAKDIHPQCFNVRNKFDRRSRSVDFNHGSCNQDTDLDVSFQDDSMLSKGDWINLNLKKKRLPI